MARIKLRIALGAVAAVIAAGVVSVATEQSAQAAWSCPVDHSCYYTGSSGSGSMWTPNSAGAWDLGFGTFNNSISSVRNIGHGTAYLYDNHDLTGYLGGYNIGFMGNVSPSADNKASSVFIAG